VGLQSIQGNKVYSPDVSHLPPPPSWGNYKNFDEANKNFFLLPADMGYVLRVDKMGDPHYSPYVDYDKDGKEKRSVQTMIDFLVVDYPNDDPSKGGMQDGVSAIGQKISQFYKISMHTKANFYALAKAAFGGNIDPAWKPNRAELEGRYVVAQILHKDPDDQGRVYAKVGSVSPYRGKTNYDNVTATGASTDAEDDTEIPALAGEADNVPF
jgi:hypothetical protein